MVPRRVVRRHSTGRKGRSASKKGGNKSKKSARRSSARHPIVRRIEDASNALSVGSIPKLEISRAELASIPKPEVRRMLSEYKSMASKLDKVFARKVNQIKKHKKSYRKAKKVGALADEITTVRRQIRSIKNAGRTATTTRSKPAPRSTKRARRGQRSVSRKSKKARHHRFAESESESEEEVEDESTSNLAARVAAEFDESEARFQSVDEAGEQTNAESESESESETVDLESLDSSDAAVDRESAKRELLDLAASTLHGQDESSLLQRMKAQLTA